MGARQANLGKDLQALIRGPAGTEEGESGDNGYRVTRMSEMTGELSVSYGYGSRAILPCLSPCRPLDCRCEFLQLDGFFQVNSA
jgi:hypothetical protein